MIKKFIAIFFICSVCWGVTGHYTTVTGAGAKTGVDWDNAWDLAGFKAWVETSDYEDSDLYFFEEGTYTFTVNIDGGLGTRYVANLIGVKAGTTNEPPLVSDYAFADDRPLFVLGAYSFRPFDSCNFMLGISFTGTLTESISTIRKLIFCKVVNTSTTIDLTAYKSNYQYPVIYCEFSCPNGYALDLSVSYAYKSYIYDSKYSFKAMEGSALFGCTVENITGSTTPSISLNGVFNCTFYNINDQAIGRSNPFIIAENIFVDCGSLVFSSEYEIVSSISNLLKDITTGFPSSVVQINTLTLDPQFKDASNQNFEPQNLNLIDEAFPTTFVGTNTTNKNVAGACQVVRKPSSTAWIN